MNLHQIISEAFQGESSVELILEKETISKNYERNAIGVPVTVAAVVKVADRRPIHQLVSLANEFNFVIQPISSGRNWGYGSLNPVNDGRDLVVLDLSGMRKIVPTSKELGLITLEPGVTQQQLYEYLEKEGWECMAPVTGAGPYCSIVGNALERGYGITPNTDHFGALTALKAILPHPDLCGEEYCSAVSSMDQSGDDFIDKTFKYGVGPYIDGLFTQSSLGIVIEATFRLARKPEGFASFYVRCFNEGQLPAAVDFVRTTLRDFEGVVGSINLMDRRRVLSMVAENPNGPGSHQVMTDEQVDRLAKQHDVPEWLIVGSIYGKKPLVRAAKSLIRKSAKQFCDQILFSDSLLLTLGKLITAWFPYGKLAAIGKQLKSLQEGIDIMLGKPNQVALPLAYWRNPRVEPDKLKELNPAQDECGLLWYAPLVAMNTAKIQEFIEHIRTTTPKYGIEPLITFTNLKHDWIDSTIPIIYDIKNPDSKSDADACLSELFEEGCKKGFIPYRFNVKQQSSVLNPKHMHWLTCNLVQMALDSNNILAAGRYHPK